LTPTEGKVSIYCKRNKIKFNSSNQTSACLLGAFVSSHWLWHTTMFKLTEQLLLIPKIVVLIHN